MQAPPISPGCVFFNGIRSYGHLYVDKTALISELLRNHSAGVVLVTRPRRFGKTLMMTTLKIAGLSAIPFSEHSSLSSMVSTIRNRRHWRLW